jgi:hypothetical protein
MGAGDVCRDGEAQPNTAATTVLIACRIKSRERSHGFNTKVFGDAWSVILDPDP